VAPAVVGQHVGDCELEVEWCCIGGPKVVHRAVEVADDSLGVVALDDVEDGGIATAVGFELNMYNMRRAHAGPTAAARRGTTMGSLLEQLGESGSRTLRTPSSKAEWVAETVERHILDAGLEPGTLVGTRDQLRAALDVAPSTIAEAIRLLTARGLVNTRTGPGGGVFVADPSVMVRLSRTIMAVSDGPGEVADALAVRDQLEPAVIVGAAEAAPASDLSRIRAAFDRMAAAESFSAFYSCNLNFHLEIAEICRNEILKGFYVATVRLVTEHEPRLRAMPGEDQDELRGERIRVHRMILDAIVVGDPDAAKLAAAAHANRGHAQASSAV
jgi:DNA-binding FadR family transcriptional regulator